MFATLAAFSLHRIIITEIGMGDEDDDFGVPTISQADLDAFPTSSSKSPDSLVAGDSTDEVTESSLDELDPQEQPLSPIEVMLVLKSLQEDVPKFARSFAWRLDLYAMSLKAVSGMCAISEKEIQGLREIEDTLLALEDKPSANHNPELLITAMRMLDKVASSLQQHIGQLRREATTVECGARVIEALQRENVVLHAGLTQERINHQTVLDAHTLLVGRIKEAKLYFQNRINQAAAQIAERDRRISDLEAQLAAANATIKHMRENPAVDGTSKPSLKRARPCME